MDFDRQTRRARQIDLTPLIDVVFLLVVFFMLSTSFVMSEAIELTLPGSGNDEVPVDRSTIALTVAKDGSISAGKQVYDVNMLDRVVRELLRRNEAQSFLLAAAPGANVQQMITALDILYVNGAKNVQMDHLYEGETPDYGGDVQLQPGSGQTRGGR